MPFQKQYKPTDAPNPFAQEIMGYLDRLSDVRTKAYGLLASILKENEIDIKPGTVKAWCYGNNVPKQSALILFILKRAFGDKKQGKGK